MSDDNVVPFILPDMKEEAQQNNERNGLAPRALTKFSEEREARLWVNAQTVALKLMVTQWEIDEWSAEAAKSLEILYDNHRKLYHELIFDEMEDAQDNARSIKE